MLFRLGLPRRAATAYAAAGVALSVGWAADVIPAPTLLHPDGRYTLKLPYADERELLGDILRFGSDVQVITPPSLRQKVRQQAQILVSLYR